MTRNETIEVLKLLEGCFPAAFKGMDSKIAGNMIEVWANMFSDKDGNVVKQAVLNLAKTNKFMPSISEINEEVERLATEKKIIQDMGAADLRGTTKELLEKIYGKGNVPEAVLEMETAERREFYKAIAR